MENKSDIIENKEKSYGEILYDLSTQYNKSKGIPTMWTWETFPENFKEPYEFMGNGLVQYYEDFLLREFLDRNRDDSN